MSASASYSPRYSPADWREPDACVEWSGYQEQEHAHAKLIFIEESVAKAIASLDDAPVGESELKRKFLALADKWQSETASLSSVTKRVMHPSYQAIVGMGEQIVPILLRDLQDNRRDWFWALTAITQENPVDRNDAGSVDKMVSAWMNWGRRKRLL